jgi:SLAP domain-containing protein
MNEKMPPLRFDEVNLVPFEVGVTDAGYYVNLFVRNGTEEEFTLNELSLQLIDAAGDVVAEGLFRFDNFGVIRLGETRPWTFEFVGDQIKKPNPDFTDFTVAVSVPKAPDFNLAIPKEWHEQMNEEQIQKLVQIAQNLPDMQPGSVNFSGFQAKFDQEKNLQIMMMFRNATDKDITFHTLPLFVRDNAGDIVAEGVFELGDFEVKAYTIKPWMFIFPREHVKKEDPDFSRWVVFTQ